MLSQQLSRMGINPTGMSLEAQRAALGAASLASLAARGADISTLTADQLLHSQLIQLFPNVQLNCYGDRIMLFPTIRTQRTPPSVASSWCRPPRA